MTPRDLRPRVEAWLDQALAVVDRVGSDYLAADELGTLDSSEIVPVAVRAFEIALARLDHARDGRDVGRFAPFLSLGLPEVEHFSRRLPDLGRLVERWPYLVPPKLYIHARRNLLRWVGVVEYRTPIDHQLIDHPGVHGYYRVYQVPDRGHGPRPQWARGFEFAHFVPRPSADERWT